MITVLASASPARLAVLRAAGIDPVVVVSGVDEPTLTAGLADRPAPEVVAGLARAKAAAVIPRVLETYRDAVVLGCDSMLLLDGTLRGKPADVDDARRQWAQMSGRRGELLTGHAVIRIDDGVVAGRVTGTESTQIRFGTPTPAEVEAYLATGEPLQVAGSLTIDGYGGWFVDGVDGDHTSVIGISLPLTRRLLGQVGVAVTDLWRSRD